MKAVRAFVMTAGMIALAASPLFAQETEANRGYVLGLGGFASLPTTTTGDIRFEGGVRVMPHVIVFATGGRFANLKDELQPTVDATAASLSANHGINVLGTSSVPALYFGGGARVEVPVAQHFLPYGLASVGIARLTPSAQFVYTAAGAAPLPDGSVPAPGTDITPMILSLGYFTNPPASTEPMFTVGAGGQVRVSPHWVVDASYRYTRVGAASSLGTTALGTHGMSFGVGYRF